MITKATVGGDIIEGNAYRMERCGGGSAIYGNCECCGKTVDTTYYLTTIRRYWSNKKNAESLTISGCRSGTFGHKKCLAAITNA